MTYVFKALRPLILKDMTDLVLKVFTQGEV
uniref:Uncharacterized protein n=1 Tax=Arundo donax TaxID=35708 RepID=A0A0A9A9S2_ARUDO